jgi:hypothetical protein
MKRIQMIERLQVAGYSATELSRMSNENLHATYLTARPLLEKNAAELAKVVSRERKRGQRLKTEIAGEQQNRQAIDEYHRWSQNNLPKPIVARRADICGESMPQNPDVLFVSHELRAAQTELRRAKQDLKRYGGREAIRKCEQARMKVQVWETQMQEVGK